MENVLQNSLCNIILDPFLYAIESLYKKINLGGCAQNVINGRLFLVVGIWTTYTFTYLSTLLFP